MEIWVFNVSLSFYCEKDVIEIREHTIHFTAMCHYRNYDIFSPNKLAVCSTCRFNSGITTFLIRTCNIHVTSSPHHSPLLKMRPTFWLLRYKNFSYMLKILICMVLKTVETFRSDNCFISFRHWITKRPRSLEIRKDMCLLFDPNWKCC